MTIEEAISYLSPIADSASDKMHYGEALEVAISALRAQAERENPQPLTLEKLQGAKSTIEEIYEAYLFSETDMVDLRCYDEELQQVHTALEKMIAYRTKPKEGMQHE